MEEALKEMNDKFRPINDEIDDDEETRDIQKRTLFKDSQSHNKLNRVEEIEMQYKESKKQNKHYAKYERKNNYRCQGYR